MTQYPYFWVSGKKGGVNQQRVDEVFQGDCSFFKEVLPRIFGMSQFKFRELNSRVIFDRFTAFCGKHTCLPPDGHGDCPTNFPRGLSQK